MSPLVAANLQVANLVDEPTLWTVGLVVPDPYGYDGTWRLVIAESLFNQDAFDLRSGERSDAVARADDGDYLVQIVGAGGLTKSWSCVGDDSTVPQTSSADFFTVSTTPNDTTMDCTLTLSNPTPSTFVIEHVYPDEPSVTATYDVVYGTRDNPTTQSPGAGGTLADGQSTTLTTWDGQPLFITGASVPGGWLTDVVCSNGIANDFFVDWNPFRADATVSGFRMRADETTTCRFIYEPLGTVTIVEDIAPDGSGAPAANYTATPADSVVIGPTAFSLADGETEKLTLVPSRTGAVSITRDGLPEYDLESVECVRPPAGNTVNSFFSATGTAFLNVRVDPGIDVVCTFSSVLAGPPTVTLSQRLLAVDPSTFLDLSVRIEDAATNVVDTVDFSTSSDPDGVTVTLPDRGEYRLTVLDDQGLEISWSCGDQTGNSTTIEVLLGESIACEATADELPPTGTGSLTLEKVASPDSSARYPVEVLLGAYPISAVLDPDGNPTAVGEGQPFTVTDLAEGEYVIIETTRLDTLLTTVDCGPGVRPSITRGQLEIDGVLFWLNRFSVNVADASNVTCNLTNEFVEPPTVLGVYVDVFPSDGSESTTLTVTPSTAVVTGPSSQTVTGGGYVNFVLSNDTEVTITQSALSGFVTTSECGFGSRAETLDQTFTTPVDGGTEYCFFENLAVPSYQVTLDVEVSTGPVDLSSDYSFLTAVVGPGLQGPSGTGTTQIVDLANGDNAAFSLDEATEITISPTDSLAGADGFEYRITCGTLSEVNRPLTFTPTADTDCSISFEARTITVEKVIEPFVVGGVDSFDIRVDSTVDGIDRFTLAKGNRRTVVAPLTGSVVVTELDPAPYEPAIECTEVGSAGPVTPSTGPSGGSSVTLPADRTSYACEIVNTAPSTPIHTVVLQSQLDLGAVDIPLDFPGIEVEFDGDVVRGANGGTNSQPPSSALASLAAVGAATPGAGAAVPRFSVAQLVQNATVPPNGSTSVLVSSGGDVTIAARTGSEVFATSISCPGGTTNPDGSVTVSGVTSDITCRMTNTAANLTLRNSVVGPTDATTWPFSITSVIAGPSAPSLGRTGSVTVAVAVDTLVTINQTNTLGATTVASACGPVVPPPSAGGFDTTQSVTLDGGSSIVCTFVSTYAAPTPPTAPPTTTTPPPPAAPVSPSVATPTTTGPASPSATTTPETTVPGGSTPTPATTEPSSTPGATAPTSAPVSTVPFTFATPTGGTSSTDDVPPSTVPPSTVPPSTVPPSDDPPSDDPPSTQPQSGVPDDPPPATISNDGPDEVFVDIGEPILVDIACDGEIEVLVDGVAQERVDRIEPSALGLGDHLVQVRCDGETLTEFRAVVYEQDEGSPAGSNMTVVVMFVMMAVGAFLFVPSAGRKRVPA